MTAVLAAQTAVSVLLLSLAWVQLRRELRAWRERDGLRRLVHDNPHFIEAARMFMKASITAGTTVEDFAAANLFRNQILKSGHEDPIDRLDV